MKTSLITLSILFISCSLAGAQSFRGLDKSPLDYAYFPDNFAHDRRGNEEAVVRVTYSRPQANGREVFGNLVPYGKVWRTGANEATEIKVYKDITIGGKSLKAGTYSLFTIPEEDGTWTIIFSSDLDFWGHYRYRSEKDVLRVETNARTIEKPVEAFTIQFDKKGSSKGVMMLAWANTLVEVPFEY